MRSLGSAEPIVEERGAEAVGRGRNGRGLGLMTLGHYIDDIYPGFIPPLLPLFIDKFGLSLALAGAIGTVLSLTTSVSQLGFGWLADRAGRRFFVVAGPLTACVFLSVAPLSSSYVQLVALAALGGFGVAAFHPSAAALAAGFAGSRKSLGVSVFAAAGALGFATGPMLILWVVATFGIGRSYLAMAPGLLTAAAIAVATPGGPVRSPKLRPEVASTGRHWKLLSLLWFVAVIRASVIMGFENFIPITIKERGGSLMSGGAAISLFLLCGSLGGVIGGYLSDKVDPRKVLLFSSIAPVPALVGFLTLGAPLNLVCLGFAGAFAFAAVPVTIVMAQESAPSRTSTASSVVMGLAWGIGGTASVLVGRLADAVGVVTALLVLALVSLVSAPCVPFLPGRGGEQRISPFP
jgi:FSR family fosmidomycin resistance protein-like MFS transporter